MLEEFRIPTGVNLVAVAPEKYEFSNLLLGEYQIDIGEFQNIENIFAGLPIVGDAFGFRIVFQGRVVTQPLAFDVLDKFAVPGAAHFAALLPIHHKFRNRVFYKREADTCVLHQYFQGVAAGAPLAVHGDFLVALYKIVIAFAYLPFAFFALLARSKGFVIAPFMQDIFQEFRAPTMAGFAALPPVSHKLWHLLPNEILGDVVLGYLFEQFLIRLPVGRD